MALTKVTGSVIKDSVSLSGNVSIGGTLTYQDVTNVDAVGVITARSNIDCNGDLDVDGHTNLDNVSVAGVSTFSDNVILAEQKELRLEPSGAFKIYRGAGGGGATNFVKSTFGSISVEAANAFIAKVNNSEDAIAAYANDRVDLYHNNQIKLTTSANGINVSGITTSGSGFMFGTDGEMYLYKSAANTATLRITSDGPYAEFKDVSGDVQLGSASGTLRLSAGGNEKLRIDSNGNIGVNCTPATSGNLYSTVDHFIAIGDSDTGIAQDGDGQLELWANNEEIASFNTGQVHLKKVTQINDSIGVGVLPQTSGSGTQFGARTNKIAIGDNDTGIAQNGDGNLCFYSNNEEIIRIDSSISGVVKNNFLLKDFQRHDTSSQHGPLGSSFSTDGNISATISNYQRGQRIVIRATVPCGIALQNGSGANYAGTSARIKLSNGSNQTYSNDRTSWYRADGVGTHETTQNLFICLYLNESNTDFNNGDTLTVTIEGKKNGGTGTSTHYIGGWSSSKEITVERYERAL